MKKIKEIIKNIPLLAQGAKFVYDWQREKKLISRAKKLLKQSELPFKNEAPPFYSVGHEPTIRCNQRCKMCYQAQTRALRREELETKEVLTIYKKLKDKTKEIKLVGGEPFVRSDIFELISFWDKLHKQIILQTNCTLINKKNIKILKKFKNITDVVTSLDGPREIHDSIRRIPGAFDGTIEALNLIKKEMPKVKITIFAVMLISDNLDHLFKVVDICKKYGLGSLNVLFEQVYSGREVEQTQQILKNIFGWQKGNYRLNTQIREPVFPDFINSKNLKRKLQALRNYGFKKRNFVNFSPFNYYNNLDKYLGEKSAKPFCLKLLSPELRINQEGSVIWCDVIEKSFGNLLEKTADEIWLSEGYQNFRKYLLKNSLPICKRCCKAAYF